MQTDTPAPVPRLTKREPAITSETAQPLEPSVRRRFETGFGCDFSGVRVHAGPAAAAAARDLHAQAYTVGTDIHFAEGRFRPHTAQGQHLLAHELAHVLQQSRGGTTADGAETRADLAADRIARGETVPASVVGGAPQSVQAKPDERGGTASGIPFPPTTLDKFALNSAELTGEHTEAIRRLAWSIGLHAGMLRNPAVTIGIVGHTDRSGPETVNDPLGQGRADAVKQALITALAQEKVDPAIVGDIPSTSMGERQPVVPTLDGVKNELNRRVEITVHVGPKAAPAPPPPTFDPFTLPPDAVPPERPGPRREKDKWQEMEENQRKIEEYDRKHPRTNKGLSEALIDKVMDDIIDPIIKKLPVSKDLKDKARSAVRKGLEKGTESACEAAVDAAGVTGEEAEALKAACKAALKEKGGGAGGRTP